MNNRADEAIDVNIAKQNESILLKYTEAEIKDIFDWYVMGNSYSKIREKHLKKYRDTGRTKTGITINSIKLIVEEIVSEARSYDERANTIRNSVVQQVYTNVLQTSSQLSELSDNIYKAMIAHIQDEEAMKFTPLRDKIMLWQAITTNQHKFLELEIKREDLEIKRKLAEVEEQEQTTIINVSNQLEGDLDLFQRIVNE